MTHTDFLKSLGAPVANPTWSWGSIRERDGAVFLMVWQDRVKPIEGCLFVQITSNKKHADKPNNLGNNERASHIELIRQGAPCYLLMCKAKDPDAKRRVREPFDHGNVFTAGEVIESQDESWIKLGPRIADADIK
jgi:hypothetical protein